MKCSVEIKSFLGDNEVERCFLNSITVINTYMLRHPNVKYFYFEKQNASYILKHKLYFEISGNIFKRNKIFKDISYILSKRIPSCIRLTIKKGW